MNTQEQQRHYLTQVRQGPGFIGWKRPGGRYEQKWFENLDAALEIVAQQKANANIWCSMGEFSDFQQSRTANNASRLKAFWFDVDAHGKGPYRTAEACDAAIRQFVQAAGIPMPNYLHATGHGVQAIWVLEEAISRADWQPVAERLESAGASYGLVADPITADAARILRLPDTLNFRDPDNPRLAAIHIAQPGYTDLAAFNEAITVALKLHPSPPSASAKALIQGIPDTPEQVAIVRAMLTAIDPDPDYDTWRNIVWSIKASGLQSAYTLAYNWSASGALWDKPVFELVWKGYNPLKERTIGFGTVVHHARKAGYTGSLPIEAGAHEQLHLRRGNRFPSRGLITQRAADIEPEPIEWLVDEAIPLGMMVVIGGQPGMGKSQIAIKLAAAITTGTNLPDGSDFSGIGSVIILANEDDTARTIRPRLDAAGADVTRVHIVEGVAREGERTDHFQLDTDIADLRDRASDIGDVKLIIIDPPSAYLGPKVDAYKEADVRRILAPLSQMANDTGALVLLVVHLNKRSDGGAQQRFGGSTAWIAAPRAAFLVAKKEGTEQRYMLPVKNNLGNDRKGFQFRVVEKLLHYPAGVIKAPHIEWLGVSDLLASELLDIPKASSAVDEAKAFLQQELAEGERVVKEIEDTATAAGIAKMTLRRAKDQLSIVAYKEKMAWYWRLPQ